MTNNNGRLKLAWKLPKVAHTSPFDFAVVSTSSDHLWSDVIQPVRLDQGTKKIELELT